MTRGRGTGGYSAPSPTRSAGEERNEEREIGGERRKACGVDGTRLAGGGRRVLRRACHALRAPINAARLSPFVLSLLLLTRSSTSHHPVPAASPSPATTHSETAACRSPC